VNNTNLKEILLTKYEDFDEKEIESLNEHLDKFDLEYKFDNKKIKVKKKKRKKKRKKNKKCYNKNIYLKNY